MSKRVQLWRSVVTFAISTVAVAPSLAQDATRPAGPVTIVAPATIEAFYSVDLFAKDSGYVSELKVDMGDHVKKGDVLAIIDDPELSAQALSMEAMLAAKEESAKAAEAAIQQSKAAVEVAKQQLAGFDAERKLAQETLKRQEALFAGKAATSQQIDDVRAKTEVAVASAAVGRAKVLSAESDQQAALANRSVAAAQVRVAKAELQRVKTLLGYLQIVAPFDGVITRRLVNPGDLAQAAMTNRTTPLFTLQKLDVVRVMCEVPESSVTGIRPGSKCEVRLFGPSGQVISSTVTRIATALQPGTRTMRAEVDVPNPDELLRPGMYAQVSLIPEAPPRVATGALQK